MKVFASTILLFLLGVMFVGLYHMSIGNDISGKMTGCPSVSHEEVICPLKLADHIESWQGVFLSVVPAFTLMALAAGAITLLVSIAPNLLLRRRYAEPVLRKYRQEHTYAFSYRPLQELFSSGILHPKLFN
jgi:hypothetical protein